MIIYPQFPKRKETLSLKSSLKGKLTKGAHKVVFLGWVKSVSCPCNVGVSKIMILGLRTYFFMLNQEFVKYFVILFQC